MSAICNRLSRSMRETDVKGLFHREKVPDIVTLVDSIFSFAVFGFVLQQGTEVREWDFEDPHFRNIVYWGIAEIGAKALRLPYVDSRKEACRICFHALAPSPKMKALKTAFMIAFVVAVFFPVPIVAALSAWGGAARAPDSYWITILNFLVLLGGVGITFGMGKLSLARQPERRAWVAEENF